MIIIKKLPYHTELKMIQSISTAIFDEKTIIGVYDAKDNITINDFAKLIKIHDKNNLVKYKTQNDKITFENGSIIEILKVNQNDTVRSRKSKYIKLYDDLIDYDYSSILDEFINKENMDLKQNK